MELQDATKWTRKVRNVAPGRRRRMSVFTVQYQPAPAHPQAWSPRCSGRGEHGRMGAWAPMPTSTAIVSKKPAVERRLGSRATRSTSCVPPRLRRCRCYPHTQRPPLPARDYDGLLRRRRVCELAHLVTADPAGQDFVRGNLQSSSDSNSSGSCGAGEDRRPPATFPPSCL